MSAASDDLSRALRLPPGPVDLASTATDATPGFEGGKRDGVAALAAMGEELAELQERLYADAYTAAEHDRARRVLVVLQGMDTAGKGGVVTKAIGQLSPIGLRVTAFKKPTEEELAHDFLWRIERALPGPGMIGVLDRSHYEDVLVPRVHGYADAAELDRRYGAIAAWEQRLSEAGTVVVKCYLHIGRDVQRERLLARLDDPVKHWKFTPGDVDERAYWDDYRVAYETAMERCASEAAPWHVVPSDRKWYRNWAVGRLLLEALRGMTLEWPQASYDVAEQRARLEQT